MSNPFTRFLNQWSRDPDFDAFVAHWDVLEQVVVAVYRAKMSVAEASRPYQEAWPWLREAYPTWEAALRPYWEPTLAGGKRVTQDPFQLLLAIPEPAAIPGDWAAMQHLPAAREAINRFVVARGVQDS